MRPKLLLLSLALVLFSWFAMDIESESTFAAVFMPLLFLVSLAMLAGWLLIVIYERRVTTAEEADSVLSPEDLGLSGDADRDSERLGLMAGNERNADNSSR